MNNPKLKALIESSWFDQQRKPQQVVEAPQEFPMTQEEKLKFLDKIKEYNKYGKAIYNEHDLIQIATELSELAEMSEKVTLSELDDKFDEISVKRNVKELKTLSAQFQKAATEATSLKMRMTSLYEDMGNILGRYYTINEDTVNVKGDVSKDDVVDMVASTGKEIDGLAPNDVEKYKSEKDKLDKKIK
jgi:hypothetical protein